ncbi:energy-coupling factor transporter transmembrane component T [Rhodoferax sp.]|uniref:energy-coupling factor transporter transmembrane component T family protein n=1 Tax=Rhodoferax sp. TaxID=50421 RepID=UPI00260E106E|nr:energy-coupling factor transporter transmembrane component T [Rhodoferax sp.]MDD2919357.1 energy-coupling factor transporter transmembrane component T [Rhodoferax sp.]
MSSIAQALQDFQSLESLAAKDSALSALDARAKILVTLGFIVTVVSFDRYAVAALLPLAFFPVVMAALGNIPGRLIGRAVLLASPFAVMLGAFNPLFDPQVELRVAGVGIGGGWLSFASILIRFALTVSAGLILVAGTGFAPLCVGLGRLGLPQVMTTQLLLLHCFTWVLANEAARMSLARELRANGRSLALAVYGPLLGHLLLRALQRAQRIHQAMLARGFNGQLHRRAVMDWQRRDTVFVGVCLLGFVLVRQLDLVHELGALVLGMVR